MSRILQLIENLCPDGVEVTTIGQVADFQRGTSITKSQTTYGDIPVIAGGQNPAYFNGEANRNGTTIVVAGSGAYAGFVSLWLRPIWVSDAFSVQPKSEALSIKYLFYFLKSIQDEIHNLKRGGGVPHVYGQDVSRIKIQVPPIEVQEEVVKILDTFTGLEADLEAELEARKRQYEHYRNTLFSFPEQGGVRWVPMVEACSLKIGEFVKKTKQDPGAKYPVFNGGTTPTGYYSEANSPAQSVVISARGSIGFVNYLDNEFWAGNSCYVIRPAGSAVHIKFLYHFLKSKEHELYGLRAVGTIPALNLKPVQEFLIPIIPIDAQQEIASKLDSFEALTKSLHAGLPAEIEARRKQYEFYRERLLTFKELG